MNFFKLITNNVLRSSRIYGGYFLSSSFSVFVFFLFSILNFHPQLKNGLGGSNGEIADLAAMGMTASQVLIVALSFIFLWYSFGIFSKARKRELSVYVMLGIKPRDLRRLLFGENMVIGAGAIVTGITVGLIFMKAILIVVQNLLSLTIGLDFYFPTIGILLTVGIYLVLFLLVSFFLTLKIETANLTMLGKSDEMPDKTPKANPFFVLLSFIFLAIGYGSLVAFIRTINYSNLWTLLSCVIFTVIATFLFFHQVSVYYYLWKKKSPKYWQGKHLLLTTTGAYRGKENANLFALITCTAAVALVGVSVTASLGSVEANTRNNLPVAININNSYNTNQITNPSELPVLKKGPEIVKKLQAAGYDPTFEVFNLYPLNYYLVDHPSENGEYLGEYVSMIGASDYNRIAKSFELEPLSPDDHEFLVPAVDFSEAEIIRGFSAIEEAKVSVEGFDETFRTRKVPVPFRLVTYQSTVIVPDDFLKQMIASYQENNYVTTYQFIHYKGWNDGSAINKEILNELIQEEADFERQWEELDQTYSYEDDAELYSEKWDELYNTQAFQFESLYSQFIQKRQANGFILMIGLLIGGVFFLFAASILYFRLFGDLDKEGRFHRSLYQIGLTPKMRHKIVIRQLLTMYFLPMVIATLHSAVAFWGIVALIEVNIWHYFFIIIAVYFIFQLLLFSLSCWRYLAHLDIRAENPQAF